MSDMFNENGFQNSEGQGNEGLNNEPQNTSEGQKNDVFDFMTGASFYNSSPEEKREKTTGGESPSESLYEETSSQEPNPTYSSYTAQNTSYTYNNPQSANQHNAYSNNPQQNATPPQYQEPVKPYDFGKNSYGQYGTPPVQPKGSSGGKKVVIAIIVVAVIVAVFSVVSAFFPEKSGDENSTTLSSQEGQTTEASSDQLQIVPTENSVATQLNAVQVAEKARPSVVGVMTYMDGQLAGEGSGVAMSVDSTGKYTYIITCAHVISDKGVSFGVRTLEGKNYEAEMVAYDVRTDIGVLKVEATDIPLAQFGDSTTLKVGETVYAIGNPGGSEYFGSMTDGIISAIDRSITSTYNMTCIQHNAAINPGNSGGALVNSAGQVIGINSSKIAATDYEGMGFAVPMSIVKPVVDNLIQYKYVPNRPKLGIEYASVSSYQLYSMVVAIKGLPAGSLVIAGISSDSSLASTDAEVGDLIIAVNGKPMDTSDVLLDLINTGAVGDSLTLTLCRVENRTYKTTTFDVTITLVEDKGETVEEETTVPYGDGGYYYGGQSSFEDFFNDYFGF